MIQMTSNRQASDQLLIHNPLALYDMAASMMHETDTAVTYVTGLYHGNYDAAHHEPYTWACGADLAQWGAVRRREGMTRDIWWTIRHLENDVLDDYRHHRAGMFLGDRSAVDALRFDY